MMRHLKRIFTAMVFAIIAVTLSACTTANPATGKSDFTPLMTPSQERQVGASEHPKILKEFGGVYDDPAIGGWVASLGGRLVANSELAKQSFTFTVLDTDVVNAFALPGGYVYITRGLLALANTEAEVAGVLAHEIGHVTARHTAQRVNSAAIANLAAAALGILTGSREAAQLGQFVGAGVLAQYSQSQEYEADLLAVRYMTRTGYNPLAQGDFLSSLNREHELQKSLKGDTGDDPVAGFFATHPNTLDRVRRAIAAAKKQQAPSQNLTFGRDALLRQIDGLVYGDSPEQGFVRGQTFSHPKLKFTFTVPKDFKLINQPRAVYARHADGSLIIFDKSQKSRTDDPLQHIQGEWAAKAQLEDAVRITVNGMPAATATTRASTNQGKRDVRFVAIRFAHGKFYRFLFLTPTARTKQSSAAMQRTTFSFRRLSNKEAAALKPHRMRIATVGGRDTISSLAARTVLTAPKEGRFRVLNALPQGVRLKPGDRVKIVTEQ